VSRFSSPARQPSSAALRFYRCHRSVAFVGTDQRPIASSGHALAYVAWRHGDLGRGDSEMRQHEGLRYHMNLTMRRSLYFEIGMI
jgi:hypothetical protein